MTRAGAKRLRGLAREAAVRSIAALYREAVEALRRGDVELARRLTREAEEVRRAARLRKPRFLRFGVCRNCGAPLVPGLSARVRLHPGRRITRVSVTCLICGYVFRMHVRKRRGGDRS